MNTLIFRTLAPIIVLVMLVFSIYILLRGHDEPGGGFIGGLIAASALAIYGIATGPAHVRRALRIDPLALAGIGLFTAIGAGLLSFFADAPFLTGLWGLVPQQRGTVPLATPVLFDIGVYCVVLGTVAAIALALEEAA